MLKLKYLFLHPLVLSLIIVSICLMMNSFQKDSIYILILETFLILMVVIGIHEIGHLIAGLGQRMTLHFTTFWFFLVIQIEGRTKVMINENTFLAFGTTKMYFKSIEDMNNLKKQLIINYIGGPFINLMIAAVMWCIRLASPTSDFVSNDYYSYFLLLNLFIGIFTLIPIEGTDGSNIIAVMKKSKQELMDDHILQHLYYKSVKDIRDVDIIWLEDRVNSMSYQDEVFSIAILKAHYYLENDDHTNAIEALEDAEKDISSGIEMKLLAFYNALLRSSALEKLNRKDIEQLKSINFWYGKCLYIVSLNLLQKSKEHKRIGITKYQVQKEIIDPHSKTY